MSKLIFAARYPGVPRAQLAVLDLVAQSVVRDLFNHAQKLHRLVGEGRHRVYGDMDFTLRTSVAPDELREESPFQRLRVTDHSAGWWADLQWRKRYERRVDFCVFAAQGDPKSMTAWEKQTEWCHSRCDMYWDICRHDVDLPWGSANPNKFDFTHPLLSTLGLALREHEEDGTDDT